MKKKLLSILVALIVCISPLFFAVGCSTDNDSGVKFPTEWGTNTTVWEVEEGSNSWLDCKLGDNTWYDMKEVMIEYCAEEFDPMANDGKGGIVKASGKQISVADAVRQGLLTCISGFDSRLPDGVSEETRTMTLMFDMTQIEVYYKVIADSTSSTVTKHKYIDKNEDGKCDNPGCGKAESDKSVHN